MGWLWTTLWTSWTLVFVCRTLLVDTPNLLLTSEASHCQYGSVNPIAGGSANKWSVRSSSPVYKAREAVSVSPSLVLGHVLSPVRSLPRHSLLLIANYTSELVC